MNRKGFAPIAFLLIILLVLAVVSIWYYEAHRPLVPGALSNQQDIQQSQSSTVSQNLFSQPIATTTIDDEEYYFGFNQTTTPAGNSIPTSLYFTSPQGVQFIIPGDIVQQLTSDHSFIKGVIGDAQDNNIVFVSTFNITDSQGASNGTSTNIIYTYNLKTQQLTPIYQERVVNQDRALVPKGIEGSKLLLWISNPGFDKDCVDLGAPLVYLELSDIAEGLQNYNASQSELASDSAKVQDCFNEEDQSRSNTFSTSTWEHYENTQFGFEIWYPPGLIVSSETLPEATPGYISGAPEFYIGTMNIAQVESSPGKPIWASLAIEPTQCLLNYYGEFPTNALSVAGMPAEQQIVYGESPELYMFPGPTSDGWNAKCNTISINIPSQDYLTANSPGPWDSNPSLWQRDTYQEMLSTFRFIKNP
jgi:hypothetical protein